MIIFAWGRDFKKVHNSKHKTLNATQETMKWEGGKGKHHANSE